MKFKNSIRSVFMGLWYGVVGFLSPAWLFTVYTCLTGNTKGFGADLGSEKSITAFFGVILFLIWLSAMTPIIYWTAKKHKMRQRAELFVHWSVFLLAGIFELVWIYFF